MNFAWLRGRRRLAGLRAQLLLWTILPLAIVLVVLSAVGVTRHRQAMTALVGDRNRSLALAEATRLGQEVADLSQVLSRTASNVPADASGADDSSLTTAAVALAEPFSAGLARFDAAGLRLAVTDAAMTWANTVEAGDLAAAAASSQSARYAALAGAADILLVAVPAAGGTVLVAALPTESLRLAEGDSLMGGEAHSALFVLDADGRLVHHHNPHGLHFDTAALVAVPRVPVGDAGLTPIASAAGQSLLAAYAPVEPPGWTLALVEDVHDVGGLGFSTVEALPLMLLLVALIALLAVSFGVAAIIRPLQELDRRAARVAWGDFDAVNTPVGGVQEIDDLRVTLAHMADRLRSYQTGMHDYLAAVTAAQEDERSRLAHELHDDTVQAFIALKHRAQMTRKALTSDTGRATQRLDELELLIDEELVALRRLIGDLRPIYLEDLGFVPALEMLVKTTSINEPLAITLAVHGETIRLAPDLELAAYRIVQQALANAVAHAQASQVNLSVTFSPDNAAAGGLILKVEDDGRGFTPPDQPADLAHQGHFGLMGMAERALLYGGHLTIDSTPGRGTRITATLPLFITPVPTRQF